MKMVAAYFSTLLPDWFSGKGEYHNREKNLVERRPVKLILARPEIRRSLRLTAITFRL
ncbi:MAG: hypothetical protein ACYCYR_17400 [Desulfobulbaceae bacterium]